MTKINITSSKNKSYIDFPSFLYKNRKTGKISDISLRSDSFSGKLRKSRIFLSDFFFAERINTDRFRLKPSDVGNPKGFVNQAQNLSGVIFFIHNFLLFVVFEKTVYNSIDFFAFFRYNLFGKSTGRIVHL